MDGYSPPSHAGLQPEYLKCILPPRVLEVQPQKTSSCTNFLLVYICSKAVHIRMVSVDITFGTLTEKHGPNTYQIDPYSKGLSPPLMQPNRPRSPYNFWRAVVIPKGSAMKALSISVVDSLNKQPAKIVISTAVPVNLNPLYAIFSDPHH